MAPLEVFSENGYGYAVEKGSTTRGWTFPIPAESFTFGYPQEMQHFIACLKKGTPPLTDGKFGLRILAVVEAMYKSAQSRQMEDVIYPQITES